MENVQNLLLNGDFILVRTMDLYSRKKYSEFETALLLDNPAVNPALLIMLVSLKQFQP